MKKRGGFRPGAGRKKTLPTGAKPRSIKMTDEENKLIREKLKEIRGQ